MGNAVSKKKKIPKTSPFLTNRLEEIQSQGTASEQDLVERLSQELKQVTAIYNSGVVLNSSLNPKDVLLTLYKECSRLVDTSNFALVICDEPKDVLRFVLAFNHGQQMKPFSLRFSDDLNLTGSVVVTQTPLIIDDLGQTEAEFELDVHDNGKKPRSWLGVPIINPDSGHETTQGAIVLWSYEPNSFDNHFVWLLSAIGTQASIALRNARLFDSSQRRATEMARLKDLAQRKADEMAFLNDVARTLSSSLHFDKVLTGVMERVEDMLDVEAGSLLLTDQATGDLVFQIALGEKADEVKPFRVPKGQGIAGEVAQTGRPLIIADCGHDERHFKALDEKTQFVTRNILCVPLITSDQVIGVLQVLNKKTDDFTQNDADLLNSIASYAAIAIENARLYETLEEEHIRTIEAEQEARKNLARDLHDGPTQLVAAIMMNIDFAKKALKKNRPDVLPSTLTEMEQLAKRATHQMRTLLFELRPLVLETQGIEAALRIFFDRRQKDVAESQSTKLTLNIETDRPKDARSPRDSNVEATIFAIVQETVNNAIKHAKADNIVVTLKYNRDGLYTTVEDDGVGFEMKRIMENYELRGSLGMINSRERAEAIGGEFSIDSIPGRGTRVSVYVPTEQKEKQRRIKKRTATGVLRMRGQLPPTSTPRS